MKARLMSQEDDARLANRRAVQAGACTVEHRGIVEAKLRTGFAGLGTVAQGIKTSLKFAATSGVAIGDDLLYSRASGAVSDLLR
jgi:hypothetical protein